MAFKRVIGFVGRLRRLWRGSLPLLPLLLHVFGVHRLPFQHRAELHQCTCWFNLVAAAFGNRIIVGYVKLRPPTHAYSG